MNYTNRWCTFRKSISMPMYATMTFVLLRLINRQYSHWLICSCRWISESFLWNVSPNNENIAWNIPCMLHNMWTRCQALIEIRCTVYELIWMYPDPWSDCWRDEQHFVMNAFFYFFCPLHFLVCSRNIEPNCAKTCTEMMACDDIKSSQTDLFTIWNTHKKYTVRSSTGRDQSSCVLRFFDTVVHHSAWTCLINNWLAKHSPHSIQ